MIADTCLLQMAYLILIPQTHKELRECNVRSSDCAGTNCPPAQKLICISPLQHFSSLKLHHHVWPTLASQFILIIQTFRFVMHVSKLPESACQCIENNFTHIKSLDMKSVSLKPSFCIRIISTWITVGKCEVQLFVWSSTNQTTTSKST